MCFLGQADVCLPQRVVLCRHVRFGSVCSEAPVVRGCSFMPVKCQGKAPRLVTGCCKVPCTQCVRGYPFTPLSPVAPGILTGGTSRLYSDQDTRLWSGSATDPNNYVGHMYLECAGIFDSSPSHLWPRACTQEEPHVCIVTRTPACGQGHRLTPDLLPELSDPTLPGTTVLGRAKLSSDESPRRDLDP